MLFKKEDNLIFFPESFSIIRELIQSATSSICISRQSIPNIEFCEYLVTAVKRGVDIKIVLSNPLYFLSNSTEEIVKHNGVASYIVKYAQDGLIEKDPFVVYLNQHNIYPAYINHYKIFLNHSKYMIFDSSIIYLGSAPNSSVPRLDIGILSSNQSYIQLLQRLFEADLCDKPFTISNNDIVVAPYNMRESIEFLLSSAQKSIYLMFPVVTDDQRILQILKNKISEGVKIYALCSPKIFSKTDTEEINSFYKTELINLGVILYESYNPIIHCRCIVVDPKDNNCRLFIGSGHLTTSSLDRSREVGINIFNLDFAEQIISLFNQIISENFSRVN